MNMKEEANVVGCYTPFFPVVSEKSSFLMILFKTRLGDIYTDNISSNPIGLGVLETRECKEAFSVKNSIGSLTSYVPSGSV